MGFVERFVEQMAQYGNFEHTIYRVYHYTISHKQLLISVTAMQGEASELHYLRFTGVEYLQLTPRWEKSPLLLASVEECNSLVETIGEDSTFKHYLFHAHLPMFTCKVLCATLQIQDTPDL